MLIKLTYEHVFLGLDPVVPAMEAPGYFDDGLPVSSVVWLVVIPVVIPQRLVRPNGHPPFPLAGHAIIGSPSPPRLSPIIQAIDLVFEVLVFFKSLDIHEMTSLAHAELLCSVPRLSLLDEQIATFGHFLRAEEAERCS